MEEAKVTSNATALIPNADAFEGQMPDLSKAQPAPLEISSEYWSPKEKGEKRRMFFMDLRSEKSIDEQSGQDIDLLVAYFVEPVDGRKRVVRQASRRLTAVFENFRKRSVRVWPSKLPTWARNAMRPIRSCLTGGRSSPSK